MYISEHFPIQTYLSDCILKKYISKHKLRKLFLDMKIHFGLYNPKYIKTKFK